MADTATTIANLTAQLQASLSAAGGVGAGVAGTTPIGAAPFGDLLSLLDIGAPLPGDALPGSALPGGILPNDTLPNGLLPNGLLPGAAASAQANGLTNVAAKDAFAQLVDQLRGQQVPSNLLAILGQQQTAETLNENLANNTPLTGDASLYTEDAEALLNAATAIGKAEDARLAALRQELQQQTVTVTQTVVTASQTTLTQLTVLDGAAPSDAISEAVSASDVAAPSIVNIESLAQSVTPALNSDATTTLPPVVALPDSHVVDFVSAEAPVLTSVVAAIPPLQTPVLGNSVAEDATQSDATNAPLRPATLPAVSLLQEYTQKTPSADASDDIDAEANGAIVLPAGGKKLRGVEQLPGAASRDRVALRPADALVATLDQVLQQRQTQAQALQVSSSAVVVGGAGDDALSTDLDGQSSGGNGTFGQGSLSGGVQQALADVGRLQNAPDVNFSRLLQHGGHPPVAEQVLVHIRSGIKNGNSSITVQLHPEELGKVDVKMELGNDGKTHLLISAERRETLEMLRNDSRTLERALADAGIRADSGSLSFNLKGGNSQQYRQDGSASSARAAQPVVPAASTVALPVAGQRLMVQIRNGVDIHV